MKLADWARSQGVHPKTAYRWHRNGTLPIAVHKLPTGTILVDVSEDITPNGLGLYARVSSHDQKTDLDRQVSRLATWAATTDTPIVRIESEIGSGINGSRPKLLRLLADTAVTTIVVEHRDRLARINTEPIETLLAAHGRKLIILEDKEIDDDLVRDMIDILTSFCARLYGQRSARNRAMRALDCAKANTE